MSKQREIIVAGNWKQNGSLALVQEMQQGLINEAIAGVTVVVCPPSPYFASFNATQLQAFSLGAQDVSLFTGGAHTGEVSGDMLAEFGCRYVIVGHSERRNTHAETNEVVAKKTKVALSAGLTPIICFGESEQVRDDGHLFEFLKQQLEAIIVENSVESLAQCVLAYEPIWAIGTGRTATPAQAQEVHAFVRALVAGYDAQVAENVSILYGGSVKPDNAKSLFDQPDIDGGLIGGASLSLQDFVAISRAAI
ncbi:triose-phosphate isomerase [Alteromonas sp. a30]|uniref:triose-phosphate isomerase n=1 Tax=Alteromonas sp. a30 TaxID=2730917 RepID=UPI00228295E2|nr:triose-phosphate isomerase [Alteromonas sp. a30]MCY7295788.1 triose-phosphate isomerase [Alteromonas sp. a30]